MLPDIITQYGDYISPEMGYKLSVASTFDSGKHELLFQCNSQTSMIYRGTESDCYEKLREVVESIRGLTHESQLPKIINMGPSEPQTQCENCQKKRKRIKNLKLELDKLQSCVDALRKHKTARGAITHMDTTHPSIVPQMGILYESADKEVCLETALSLEFHTEIQVKQDENAYLFVRCLREELDGWEILVKSLDGTLRALILNYMGGWGSPTGTAKFFRSYREHLKAGDIISLEPVGQNAKLDVLSTIQAEARDEESEDNTDG